MATLPLDIDDMLREVDATMGHAAACRPIRTIGHMHLRIADIKAAEAFFHGSVGLDMIVRSCPSALFVSAGGYHHHIGLNTWESRARRRRRRGRSGSTGGSLCCRTRTSATPRPGAWAETGDPVHTDDGVLASGPGRQPTLCS